MDRRESLKLLATAPFFAYTGSGPQAEAKPTVRQAEFFTDQEMELVGVLADLIIPADARSGSATDAGVPEFIDFMMTDRPELQVPMRGGLAWLDGYSSKRAGARFVDLPENRQKMVLDDLAWPEDSAPELAAGVAFFSSFRDMVASGFWTSRMGVEDLQYMGNVYVQEWTGCPPEVMAHLGLSDEE